MIRPGGAAGAIAQALVLATAMACVYADLGNSNWKPHSQAFAEPGETSAGREMGVRLAEHPGESALYLLGSGLDAFAARVLLIDAAERAVDVQYYIFRDDVTGRLLLSRLLRQAC